MVIWIFFGVLALAWLWLAVGTAFVWKRDPDISEWCLSLLVVLGAGAAIVFLAAICN